MKKISKWEKSNHAFLRVMVREMNRMISRRIYFGACIVLPLFSLFFMSTIFGNGQMDKMPIGIVDLDNTVLSREVARSVSAVPTFNVTKYYSSQHIARQDVRKKAIYGYLVIPYDFESDATAGRQTSLCYYYHYALLSVGGEIESGFETVLRTLSINPVIQQGMILGINPQNIINFLLPVTSSQHPLFNPNLNYAIYLSNPFFFVLFQILILLTTVYAVGSEIKFGTAHEWLQKADMNILTAICGKLLPYTIIYCIIAIFANYVIFGWENIPYNCSLFSLNITAVLFIIATQALALFIYSLFPALSIIISMVSMVGSLGATLSGITFPVSSMYPPIHYTSYLLPVRHFTEIYQAFLYGDVGFAYTWWNYSVMFIFILTALLLLPRLKKALINATKWEHMLT